MARGETELTRCRYDRVANVYDVMQLLPERHMRRARERLWSLVRGPMVLEVGVGTGLNVPHYPDDVCVTAIDLSEKMLARARRRAERLGKRATFRVMDAQALEFDDGTFDTVVSTCVFCSVPAPLVGLAEVRRVVKRGGMVLFLEHVRARQPLLGRVMDVVDPLVVRLMGPHINRRTVEAIAEAGLVLESVTDLDSLGIMKLVVARAPETDAGAPAPPVEDGE